MSWVAVLAFLLPERASTVAPRTDALFVGLLVASGLLVVLLVGLNLTFLIRYRRGSPAKRGPIEFSTWKLETAWISATTLGFLGFFFWSSRIYLDEERTPAGAYEIEVTGRQWMWDVRHPNGKREFDSLHVPAGRDIRLLLTSEDVIHSLYLPAMRIKQDVVPGRMLSLWFHPTNPGEYPLFCAEYCGTKHSAMTGKIVVMRPEDYAQWLGSGTTPQGLQSRGRELFVKYSCNGCHDQPSQIHAPPLEHLYGSMVPLQDKTFVRADEVYLHDSIMLPAKQIVAGYQPIMPSFQGVMPESDLLEIISYLKSLAQSSNPQPVSP